MTEAPNQPGSVGLAAGAGAGAGAVTSAGAGAGAGARTARPQRKPADLRTHRETAALADSSMEARGQICIIAKCNASEYGIQQRSDHMSSRWPPVGLDRGDRDRSYTPHPPRG